MYEIVDDTGRLWATADTLQAAALAAKTISEEEQRVMHVVIPRKRDTVEYHVDEYDRIVSEDEFTAWLVSDSPAACLTFDLIEGMYPCRLAMMN